MNVIKYLILMVFISTKMSLAEPRTFHPFAEIGLGTGLSYGTLVPWAGVQYGNVDFQLGYGYEGIKAAILGNQQSLLVAWNMSTRFALTTGFSFYKSSGVRGIVYTKNLSDVPRDQRINIETTCSQGCDHGVELERQASWELLYHHFGLKLMTENTKISGFLFEIGWSFNIYTKISTQKHENDEVFGDPYGIGSDYERGKGFWGEVAGKGDNGPYARIGYFIFFK